MRVAEKIIAFSLVAMMMLTSVTSGKPTEFENETTGTPEGWSENIRLTYNSTSDDYQAIAINHSNIYLVWSSQWFGKQIYYMNSADSGKTWSERNLLSRMDLGCMNPDIGLYGEALHVIWDDNNATAREIKYRRSTNGGQFWEVEKMISTDDGWNSQYAKIAVNGSEIHVVWVDYRHRDESFPFNTELYYMRSLDGGITWDDGLGNIGQERRLTNAFYESTEASISVEGDVVHVVWGDTRNGVTTGDIYYMRSLDKGATWDDGLGNVGQDRRLTTNGTNHGPSTMGVNGSTIHVTWVDEVWPGPVYCLYYRNSTDNGFSWNSIQLLVDGVNGPNRVDVAVDGNDIHIVWDAAYGDKSIYYINFTNTGGGWSVPLRVTENDTFNSYWPRIAVTDSIRHVVWWDDRDGNSEIYYKRYPDFPTQTVNITLSPGWNLISFPVTNPKINGTAMACAEDLITATGCTITSKWNASSQQYVSYIAGFNLPTDPENFIINNGDAFFIWWNGSTNITFSVIGYSPGLQNVHLLPGWNMVGYVNATTGDVEDDWADQVSCGPLDDICWYDGTTFRHYIFPGTEMELIPTRGFFVWSDDETWLSY